VREEEEEGNSERQKELKKLYEGEDMDERL
jgi:hypothetical protein